MNRGWWLLLIILFVVSVTLRLNLLLLVTFLMGLLLGAAWLWQKYSLDALTYVRRFDKTRLFYGETTELFLQVTNAKPLPLPWLRAEDEFASALEVTPEKAVYSFRSGRRILHNMLSLRWYERVTRRFAVQGTQRGAWRFGPTTLVTGDLFGFTTRHMELRQTDTILVYPKLLSLSEMGIPAQRPFGDLKTDRRLVEDPLRLMGARPYVSGDSYRHIHWKATSHRQSLQTKVFEPSASRPLAVFVNVNTSLYLIEGLDYELREYAISAAASIAQWAYDNGHPIGMYVNAVMQPGGLRLRIRPGQGANQLTDILESLARISGYGRWPLADLLMEESRHLPYGTSIVAVTAVVSDEMKHVLMDLTQRGSTATLVTLGPRDVGILPAGVRTYPIGGRKEWRELATLAVA